jgi:hypothetical protein
MRIDIHSHFQCLDYVKHLVGRTALPRTLVEEELMSSNVRQDLIFPPLPRSSTWKRSSATWTI